MLKCLHRSRVAAERPRVLKRSSPLAATAFDRLKATWARPLQPRRLRGPITSHVYERAQASFRQKGKALLWAVASQRQVATLQAQVILFEGGFCCSLTQHNVLCLLRRGDLSALLGACDLGHAQLYQLVVCSYFITWGCSRSINACTHSICPLLPLQQHGGTAWQSETDKASHAQSACDTFCNAPDWVHSYQSFLASTKTTHTKSVRNGLRSRCMKRAQAQGHVD